MSTSDLSKLGGFRNSLMCFGDDRPYFGDSFRHEVKTDASLTKIRMIESWSRYAFLWGLMPLPFIGEWTPQGAELTYSDDTVLTGGKMDECGSSCGWFPLAVAPTRWVIWFHLARQGCP